MVISGSWRIKTLRLIKSFGFQINNYIFEFIPFQEEYFQLFF